MKHCAPLTVFALVVSMMLILGAGPDENAKETSGLTPEQAKAAFERMKKLVGSWEATINEAGDKVIDTYELIANDSVLVHRTEFPDDPSMTMLTMYHLDGDDLILKHYCAALNQPEMKATKFDGEKKTVVFTYTGGTNMASRDVGHMDEAHITISDADHYLANWKWYADGGFQGGHEFKHTRTGK